MKNYYNFLILTAAIFMVFFTGQLKAQYRPNIYFDPVSLEATVGMNDSVVVHSVLHNATDYTLDFSFPGYTSKGQGGPDTYGYTWIDSEEPGGPEWSWTDISETGTLVEGLGDDLPVGPFEIGFNFHFYGETRNHFWINPNGVISFNEIMIPFYHQSIPTNNDFVDFIAWFWDDLLVDSLSRVYYKNFDEKTVIQFTHLVHYPGSESFITGQVILMANNSIWLKYRLVSEGFQTTNCTVGLQSWNPAQGLQVAYNAEYVHSELAVRFDLNTNFITHVQPATLTLPPGTQETIWITYSSENFEVGNYEQDLKCTTSHPEMPYLLLHNVMHVVNQNAAGFKGYVTDAATGWAINDVLVTAGEGNQTYTNNNGWYELPAEQGSYNVHFTREGYQPRIVEDTTALPGFSILSVTMEPNDPTYFLVGRVYAGDYFLETGFAYGYKMIEDEVVDVYAEMVGEEGWYEFTGLAPANYIVKAEPSPNSIYYGTYLPTYYGDVLHWEDATPIVLNQNTDGAHIHLNAEVNAPQGPGNISGTIENSGRTADVPIILRTSEPGVAIMTLSNADGSFAFNDLAYGTYEIFAEIAGKSIVPMTIELNETTPSYENVDMLVTGNEIVFLGIEESEYFEMMPYLYPNPAVDNLNITFNMKKPAQVAISIFDINGKKVLAEDFDLNGHQNIIIPLEDLSDGIYLIKVISGMENLNLRFVKN